MPTLAEIWEAEYKAEQLAKYAAGEPLPLKLCTLCNTEKPHNPFEKKNSKASKFHGNWCWSCYLKNSRTYNSSRS